DRGCLRARALALASRRPRRTVGRCDPRLVRGPSRGDASLRAAPARPLAPGPAPSWPDRARRGALRPAASGRTVGRGARTGRALDSAGDPRRDPARGGAPETPEARRRRVGRHRRRARRRVDRASDGARVAAALPRGPRERRSLRLHRRAHARRTARRPRRQPGGVERARAEEEPVTTIRSTVEEVLEEAARRTGGLTDLGEGPFVGPLERLLDSLEREARLHDVGRVIARERVLLHVVNRLLYVNDRAR